MKHKNLFVSLVIAGALALLASVTACASAPHSLEELQEMSEPEYQSWRQRVAVWTAFVTDTVVTDHPETREEVQAFGELLVLIGAQPLPPDATALSDAAEEAGLGNTLVALLVLELQAQLDLRGGLPGGPRANEIVGTIGASILEGLHPQGP